LRGFLFFNLAMLIICAAVGADLVPRRLYDGLMRGLHNTIGITTPSERQVRWVLIVWIICMLAIFDAMAALLVYAF
jgi:hypothetical protein